jgi:hypothetical protein
MYVWNELSKGRDGECVDGVGLPVGLLGSCAVGRSTSCMITSAVFHLKTVLLLNLIPFLGGSGRTLHI